MVSLSEGRGNFVADINPGIVSRNEETARKEIATLGYTADLGVELTRLEPGYAEGRLRVEDRHRNTNQIVHGGVLYALCDTMASLAAASWGDGGATVQGNISYMRSAQGDEIICRASVDRYGRHMVFSHADVFTRDGQVCHSDFIHMRMPGTENFGIRSVYEEEAE